jgi:hypothetical protein
VPFVAVQAVRPAAGSVALRPPWTDDVTLSTVGMVRSW